MDWNYAIERQRTALLGILATLVALAASTAPSLPRRLHRHILRLLRPAEAAARRLVIASARTCRRQHCPRRTSDDPGRPQPS